MGLLSDLFGESPMPQKGDLIRRSVNEASVLFRDDGIVFTSSGYTVPLEEILGYEYVKIEKKTGIWVSSVCGIKFLLSANPPESYFYGFIDQDGMFHEMPWDFHRAISTRDGAKGDDLSEFLEKFSDQDVADKADLDEIDCILAIVEEKFGLYDEVMSNQAVYSVNASDFVFNVLTILARMRNHLNKRVKCPPGLRMRAVEIFERCGEYISNMDDATGKAQLAAALEFVSFGIGEKELDQQNSLESLQSLSAALSNLGISPVEDDLLVPLGRAELAEDRRIIVCTEDQRSAECVLNPQRGVFITSVEEIKAYNRVCDDCTRLEFALNHPVNGVVYVQHPIRKNQYLELSEYNSRMLEMRYEELIRILVSLGAKTITCTVENATSAGQNSFVKHHIDGSVSVSRGEMSLSHEGSRKEDRLSALNRKLSCRIEREPSQAAYLPSDTVFFQFEDRWQQMAKDVLSGQRKSEVVDLVYRKEFSLSSSEAQNIGAKLGVMIPSFSFSGNANYSREYESEIKNLESTIWHYEVEFDSSPAAKPSERAGEKITGETSAIQGIDKGRSEAVILGRAKRYAKTEEAAKSGMLTDAQRADLEKLAAKYGIDEFRLEELIDEAFA